MRQKSKEDKAAQNNNAQQADVHMKGPEEEEKKVQAPKMKLEAR